MDGCLTDIRKTLGDKLLDKAIEHARYLFCFTCIVKEFDEEKRNFEAERGTIAQLFDKATQKDKDIKSNAQRWKEQADKHIQIQEDTEKEPSCFLGFCPDCIWRYKRGKELATKIKEMKNLMREKFDNVELTRCLPGVELHSSQNYISLKSRELICKELLDALKDDSNYIVGLHGMGGTGKTTLAREVGKQLKTLEHFKYVIDTTVSFNVDIKKIQDDIAGPLGLKWEDCNESDRPKKLWNRLTNGEKILVILDDVWGNLNFDDIKLPNSDNHNGCKVLVTTRNLEVCNKMGCAKPIQLGLLTEEEAWTMFKEHADPSNILSKSILDKGRKIANECKGLPVAIATIASSLKGLNSREEWDVALNSLKKPVSMGNVDDHLVDIFKCLKFSYDYLKDEKAKGLFLLCSAFPEDEEISVELLTRLGIGVNLFGEDYDKYNDARSQVIAAKNKLLRSCLLLETEQGDVKMHDLVREVAQWIAKEEILVENLFEKNQKSLVEKSKNIKNLYFHGKLSELFSSKSHWSDGSKLKILIAKECDEFQDVPTPFLENMAGLRVLIFSNSYSTRHSSLANSIKLMINIRSLSVEKVILGDISVLGSLQSLETLELHYCEIEEFSPEIAELKKLRLLCLKECQIKSNNPFEVIQNCPSLEELYFLKSFNKFCQEITLPRLGRLERYVLSDFYRYWDASQLKVVALRKDYFSKATYKDLIQTSYCPHLFRIEGYRNLMPQMVPIDGMNDLIELHLEGSSQLQCLVDTKHNSQVPIVFSNLAVLELERMEALEELCNGPISSDSMNNLKKLYINECENLQSLFKCSPNLSNLKTVTLISCSRLVSVFKLSTSQVPIFFSKLVVLKLEKMEALEELCNGPISFDSMNNLEKLSIKECKHLRSLFKCSLNLSNLKRMKLEKCSRLVSVFELSTSQSLPLLEELKIFDCEKLENIITLESRVFEESADGYSLFPKLKVLHIEECPQLQFILPILSAQDLLLLEVIKIKCCQKLKYIFGQHQDVKLTSLKKVVIDDLPNFIDIYPTNASSVSKDGCKPQTQQGPIKGNTFSLCCYRYKLKSTKTPLDSEDQPQDCSISMLEGSTSEITAAATVSTFTETKNKPPAQEVVLKQKAFPDKQHFTFKQGIQINVEEGSTSDNANTLTSSTLLDVAGSSSGQLVTSECKTSSQSTASSISKDGSKPQTQQGPIKGNTFSLCCYRNKLKSTKTPLDSEDQPQDCSISMESNSYCLEEIKISNVPKMKSVFIVSSALRMLETLTIVDCEELKQIIIDTGDHNSTSGNNFGNVFPKLKRLEVSDCVQLEYIFGHYNHDHHNQTEMANQLASGDFIKELSGNEENGQQMNLSLEHIELVDLPMMRCLFVGLKYLFVLNNLTEMKIVRCEKLEIVFSTSVLRCLPQLVSLEVEDCEELKHIIEDDLEDKVFQSSNTFFPKLETLIVTKCDKLKYVFPVSICKEFLELKAMFIREANELEEIFKSDKKDEVEEISKTEVQIPNLKWVGFANLPSLCHAQAVHFQAVKHRFVHSCQKLSLTSCNEDVNPWDFVEDCDYEWCCRFREIQEECYEATSEDKLTSPEHDEESKNDEEAALTFSETDSDYDNGNDDELEGSTPEITAAETVSTITETKNMPPKQKGIQINVEEGNTSANAKTITSSTHLDEDVDSQIAMTSFSVSTSETNDQGSLNHDSFKKVISNIEEQFPKDDDIIVSKSKPSPSITSPVVYQFPPVPCKEDPCQKVEDLSSSLLVKSELEQLVSKNHLDYGNFYLLNDFFVKHASVRLKDTSLSNRYKGCAYNLLAELLKFLKTHSVLEVLGSFHSEFVELLQDARSFGFDKDWLDGVERRALFPDIERQKLLDYKQQVTKDVEGLRLKIGILSEHVEDLKQQLTSSEAVLDGIIQQEVVLSAPIGY